MAEKKTLARAFVPVAWAIEFLWENNFSNVVKNDANAHEFGVESDAKTVQARQEPIGGLADQFGVPKEARRSPETLQQRPRLGG